MDCEKPQGPRQICRYNNGTGDQLDVPLGTTAFVSGKKMFEILSLELKKSSHPIKVQIRPSSLRRDVKSNGLGIKVENMEQPRDQLPSFEESKIKTFPLLSESPVTGNLHLQVHPCGAEKLIIEPLSKSSSFTVKTMEIREIFYKLQQPGISPDLVYRHNWKAKDLCLFHNRGVLHTVIGAFKEDQDQAFWQCNMASSDEPLGPDADDLQRFI
ncbi:taurine catabolism dioxygenase TauD, TfdA family-domain-containing protein [Phakopsora pachyrhizi]|uniref:Taurine catabolism dioxygenase TauD, TfdA family-domain-containing protein n=1 Tax=Phakopsora pachyrhizi TaxID=170000 RepID=A0AAV0BBC0_PHAPC|nr:taurine catabolism dioxygenase TauD, TfdA family-domain-containing protein [Phakopsora pachyrhizi]